jgi:putative FmdB family regulatory protein
MPLYEYVCSDCNKPFETLVTSERRPACPACRGTNLQKQLSVFAVSTGSGSRSKAGPVGGCGTCGDPRGPGSCSMN